MLEKEQMIQNALDIIEFLTDDSDIRRLYEIGEQARKEEISLTDAARAEGYVTGKMEIAQNMLKKGMDVNLIAEVTDFSVEELEGMKGTVEK